MKSKLTGLRLASLLLALVLFALPAKSANDDFVTVGGYLMLGGLTAFDNFQGVDGFQVINTDFDTSFGFVIKGGYRFHPLLAAELEGDFISGFDSTFVVPGAAPPFNGPLKLTVDGGNITGNVLAYLPLGRFQPYGLFGLGGMWANLRSTYAVATVCGPSFNWFWYCRGAYARLTDGGAFVMKFGGGLDVFVTEDWAINIEATYVLPTGELTDLQYVNLNWGFKFVF